MDIWICDNALNGFLHVRCNNNETIEITVCPDYGIEPEDSEKNSETITVWLNDLESIIAVSKIQSKNRRGNEERKVDET